MIRRIERWLWIHATCRQGWRCIPLPLFLVCWWGERSTGPCGRHTLEHLDDYGCDLCWHEAHVRYMAPRIKAWLAKRRKVAT